MRLLAASIRAAAFCSLLLLSIRAMPGQATWTVTPVPMGPNWSRASFNDVVAIDGQDAWAVGQFRTPIPPYFSEGHTLAMHWDGTSWSHVPTPDPSPYPGGAENELHAVDALGPDDVWAGGSRFGNAGGLSVGDWIYVQHWDGTSWAEVPVPGPPGGSGINFSGTRIHEVLALGPDDVWFGGAWATPNVQQASLDWHPLAMHWDGSNMTLHPTPVVHDGGGGFGFQSVSMSAVGPNDIWAACSKNSAGGTSLLNVILHWDGSSWTRVSVPDGSVQHTLHSIEALAPDDVWVFGEVSFSTAPYILHYDGTSWIEVSTGPSATASYAFGPDDIYAAGASVSHFDGTGWTAQTTFPGLASPAVRALDGDGGTELWAVGSHWSFGSKPLAARADGLTGSVPSVSVRTACLHPAPAQSLATAGLPVIGQTIFLHSGDPTNAAQLAPGAQSFLFVALQPYPTAPCGLPVPGFGAGAATGEVMIDFGPGSLVLIDGPRTWNGPGAPAVHPLAVPAVSALAGVTIHAQGLVLDPAGASAPGIVTEALDLRLGL